MKGKVEKKGLRTVNRSLTGILAAAIVMSHLSGTGLVVRAAEMEKGDVESTIENDVKTETTEEIREEITEAFLTTEESEETIKTEKEMIEEVTEEV